MSANSFCKCNHLKKTKIMAVDRISALPDDVIYHILSFLRVDEAVLTSALSNRWRYLWTFNPNMCFPYYDDLNGPNGRCSISVINQCMKQYQAKQLQALQIDVHIDEDASVQIQQWIDFAVQKNVEELTVQALWFEFPDPIYSAQALKSLTLNYCRLQRPSVIKSFGSLESLKYLCLAGEMSDGAIEAMLSKCQSLQTLYLIPYTISAPPLNLSISLPQLQDLLVGSGSIFGSLEICAPSLRVIRLSGYICHKLELHSSPLLEHARFLLKMDPDTYQSPRYDSMKSIEILHLTHVIFEMIYTAHYVSGGRRLELNNLREIHLKHVENFNSVYPLVRFFKGCSALEEARIYFCGTSSPNLDVEQLEALDDEEKKISDFGNYFNHLKRVVLTGFSGKLKEIRLVKFLLQTATTLHLLQLEMNKMLPNDMKFILEYIFSLPRISPHATIQHIASWDLP